VALGDADDSRARATDVVEHGFRDFQPHTEPLKGGRERAAKVVKAPVLHAARYVERGLRLAEAIEGAIAGGDTNGWRAASVLLAAFFGAPSAFSAGLRASISDLMGGDSGTICVAPFFAGSAGIVQALRSSASSPQVIPATS